MLMMKGLMGCCLNHEIAMDRIKAKGNSTEDELNELKVWKMGMEKKLAYFEQVREKLEKQTELLRQVLEDKEKEIWDTKDQLRQAKEEAIREYCDSNALLAKLRGSFAKGFDDALHQVKASYPDLDVSHVNIDAQAQTSVQPIHSESTDELFADDAPFNVLHGDEKTVVESQGNPIVDSNRKPDEVHTPVQQ